MLESVLYKRVLSVFAFCLFALFVSCGNGLIDKEPDFIGSDVTAGIEVLGTIKDAVPANIGSKILTHAYARNIWDMQFFDGRIFLGYGCWSNSGALGATNAGPIPILALDVASNEIVRETVNGTPYSAASEEQLWRFRVIDGKLYTPGCDAREGWELGNIYVRQNNGTWLKKRTIPDGIHVFDLAEFNGKLYVADSSKIMYSDDEGDTWKAVSGGSFGRVYTLLPWKDALYGFITSAAMLTSEDTPTVRMESLGAVKVDRSNTGVRVNIGRLPGSTEFTKTVKVYAAVGNTLAFTIGGLNQKYQTEGMDIPLGLYYSSNFPNDFSKAVFPEAGAVPIDILARGNSAYVLTYIENAADDFTVIVYKTSKFSAFEECFRFDYGTFARSFEEHKGEFYFGMGTTDGGGVKELVSELSGTIIKVPYDVCHK